MRSMMLMSKIFPENVLRLGMLARAIHSFGDSRVKDFGSWRQTTLASSHKSVRTISVLTGRTPHCNEVSDVVKYYEYVFEMNERSRGARS